MCVASASSHIDHRPPLVARRYIRIAPVGRSFTRGADSDDCPDGFVAQHIRPFVREARQQLLESLDAPGLA